MSAEERKVLIWELRATIAKQERIITSYQIAKDNLELKLIQKYVDAHDGMMPSGQPIPVQVY